MGEPTKAFISETYSEGKWTSTYVHEKSLREVVQNFSRKEFFNLVCLASNAINSVNNSAASLEYNSQCRQHFYIAIYNKLDTVCVIKTLIRRKN